MSATNVDFLFFEHLKKRSYIQRKKTKLKGAVFVKFSLNGDSYAFGSVHLDASSEENRGQDIKMIHETLKKEGFPNLCLMFFKNL